MTKIVICGGHLTPALALIDELGKNRKIEIIFFGRRYTTEGSKTGSHEYRIITTQKIKFYNITAGRLQRIYTKYTLVSLLKIPGGLIFSLIYLLWEQPKLIISFGGYLSVPVVFAGWLLGIDSITHEQSIVPGLATKINSLFTKKIFLSYSESQKYFENNKIEIIGNLFRRSLFNTKPKSPAIAAFLREAKKLILVIGGNQGSHVLNQLIFALINDLGNYSILHQAGSTNWQGDLDKAKDIKNKNYLAVEYIDSADFGAVLNRASLVIARAGANTIWDLAIFKKPAILVPLPISSGNEQFENARILQKIGLAKVFSQDGLSLPKMRQAIEKTIKNPTRNSKAIAKYQKTLPQDASTKLAKYILTSLKNA